MRLYIDVSPCTGCLRVQDPNMCENKNCKLWRRWFIGRWNQLRRYPRKQLDKAPEMAGVPLGGRRYALPHLIRDYLAKDPCQACVCTPDLCRIPCRARQQWAKIHEEMGK